MKLKTRLMLVPALGTTLMLATVSASIALYGRFETAASEAQAEALEEQRALLRLGSQVTDQRVQLYRVMALMASLDEAQVRAARRTLAERLSGLVKDAGQLAQNGGAEHGKRLASLLQRLAKSADQAIDLATVDPNTGVAALQTVDKDQVLIDETIAAMSVALAAHQQGAMDALKSDGQRDKWTLLGLGVLCGVAAMAFSLAVQRRLLRGVLACARTAQAVAAGDLAVPEEAAGDDELDALRRDLRTMVLQTRATICTAREAADGVSTASGEVSAGNSDLSRRTEEAASHLQQTASAMTQLAEGVDRSAGAAHSGHDLAHDADDAARRGGEVVSQVVATMDEIGANSRRIADVIGIIDQIAFQTKHKRKELHRELMEHGEAENTRRASVVVTNPTHLAVAIAYEKDITPLPLVLAKGEDAQAFRIAAIARECGIPVMQDIPLARALMKNAAVNDYIPADLIEPVAQVLRAVRELKQREDSE